MQCTICLKSLHSFLLSTEMEAKYAFVIHFKTTTVLVAKCDSSGTWWRLYLFWVTYDVRTKSIKAIWGWLILLKTSEDVKVIHTKCLFMHQRICPGYMFQRFALFINGIQWYFINNTCIIQHVRSIMISLEVPYLCSRRALNSCPYQVQYWIELD